ncbi:SF3 helicase domain-containing protein [Trichonephila clavata]|uniref:SF3 helicase domain-containing protein n=1 Tax=Trichonephila clavata TaxID=2740835 RepID=A0A8X6HYQ6_TRICU|nr:SF3 helicase domain-containing protein [Trichonephila clavata]
MSLAPFHYLTSISHLKDAPQDSYIIYNMKGGIYYIKQKDFLKFANFFIKHTLEETYYTIDLALAIEHALILDLDFHYKEQYNPTFVESYIERYLIPVLKSLFHQIPCFTMISAIREGGGLHIHLPEFQISHDDYIVLCIQLQSQLNREFSNFSVTLDVVKNFNLSKSTKPGFSSYVPFNIEYFEKDKTFTLGLLNEHIFETHRNLIVKQFKCNNKNTFSIFRQILPLSTSLQMFLEHIYLYMMPVIVKDNLHHINYHTTISQNKQLNYQTIAHFTYKEKEQYEISKSVNINFKQSDILTAYNFIKNSAMKIENFHTENYALKRWLKYFKNNSIVTKDAFEVINKKIVEDNVSFSNNVHPIKTIMEFNDYYYGLPVFLALLKELHVTSNQLINMLRSILSTDDFLNKMEKINTTIFESVSKEFSINTILYCGSNLCSKTKHFGDKLTSVVLDMKKSIESCISSDEMSDIILKILKRYSPVIVAHLKHSCKKPVRYYWNIVKEQWQEVLNDNDIKSILVNIKVKIKKVFLNSDVQLKIEEFCKNVDVNVILAVITSESNMDRLTIQMDQHKWYIKTENGILDLLTGNVSGVVPEFYLSDNTLNLSLDRLQLINLRTDEKLINTCNVLTSNSFFNRYLKYLLIDLTNDFFDTLVETAIEFNIFDINCEFTMSMLKFYMHLCKYVSFEYEQLIFLLDVLSSILIATNYSRHFYILQGITGNGKSKFFEMITKVFGTYSQSIRNVNLQSGKGVNAQPEIASSLFRKRIIAIEELSGKIDENLVKELTGNSQTSFRNLYEQNMGGRPSAKLFASTNTTPVCTATEAFRARVIVFPFNSKFVNFENDLETSVQIETDRYKLEKGDSIVDESFIGFFTLIYIHLFQNMNFNDGYIHIRPEPDIMKEFKEQYLSLTSLYRQFKQYADVQIVEGEMITVTDLLSAIRQFLVETKRLGIVKDNEIVTSFDEEYGHLKQTKSHDSIYEMSAMDLELEENEENEEGEEPMTKIRKLTYIIYYENIVIRNLKKKFN